MVASNTLGSQWARDHLNILGTDISGPVIISAEQAKYKSLEGVSALDQSQYFSRINNFYLVRETLRKLCMFRRLNLSKPTWPFQQQFQIIFCRNILYYFKPEHQAEVLRKMHANCAPGGWLVTSVTESIRGLDVPWVSAGSGFYWKTQ